MSGRDRLPAGCYLFPGDLWLSREPALISTVLGSGVAITLWAENKKIGGMAHFLYPFTEEKKGAPSLYGNIAVKELLKRFSEAGEPGRRLKGQIFGGALAATPESVRAAGENVRIARTILHSQHVAIVSEDVGGTLGRKIIYHAGANETLVYRVNALRKDDWYPYQQEDKG